MIYIDSKSITACIVVNDRQLSINVPKYLASIADTLSSVQSGAPAVLRGRQSADSVASQIQTSLNETHSYSRQNDEAVSNLIPPNRPLNNILNDDISSEAVSKREIDHTKRNYSNVLLKQNTIAHASQTAIAIANESEKPIAFSVDSSINNSIKQTNHMQSEEVESKSSEQNSSRNRAQNEGVVNESKSTDDSKQEAPIQAKVLCLSGEPYGRTMNQYLQLATILHQLGINGTSAVAFKNPLFTSFYKTWFEPRDDVIISYNEDSPCDAEYDAVTLHYLYFAEKWKPIAYQFETLIPKASIREEAVNVMKEYAGPSNIPVTTVHRRDLEGACVLFAEQKNLIACPNIRSSQELTVMDFKNACLIDYPMIANATHGTNVVLFTDGQVPALDRTFPNISKHSFPVQSWMMALSDVHYGNPFSTVDTVVYFWRMALSKATGSDNIEMRPKTCYEAAPTE
jgi:hypothetical protein